MYAFRVSSMIAMVALSISGGHAHAAGLITCAVGTAQVTYNPGLLLVDQQVQIASSEVSWPCISLPLQAGTASVTATLAGVGTLNCAALQNSSGTQTLKWADGSTSLFSYQTQLVNRTGA
ncbi:MULTISPECIES: hypothetical protein [unclassified Lysobacter]|uniref:hypothetical protein n=1 Tax=unclassified Lysobacter TaxID=2635362 RepID=UPI001BED1C64|nr:MULTISPECIES: hypothetical protein [unclassified Lysobacter]MBT2748609.1 hypothetical protein [Lysobacter sp. ISL-42]MBT2751544.1 hypothetical protein [Lysobacter sp. ISL-50]MBT2775738.1 hypothetical protein [Lysobacter sp. ISL-54]MBT2782297.1 hypothetical protein [Lysobacter sp. ISL-52]